MPPQYIYSLIWLALPLFQTNQPEFAGSFPVALACLAHVVSNHLKIQSSHAEAVGSLLQYQLLDDLFYYFLSWHRILA